MNIITKCLLLNLISIFTLSISYANSETNEVSENKEADQIEKSETAQKEISKPEIDSSENFLKYEQLTIENQNKQIRENWKKTPYYKEVNGLNYLEFEAIKSKSKGHIFLFPSWNTTYKVVSLAKLAALQNYDCFVFFPQPDLKKITPSDENEQEKEPILSKYLDSIEVSISTIGIHDKINLFISEGNTLSWILTGIEQGKIPNPNGIIALNANYYDELSNNILAEQVSSYSGYFLDIQSYENNSWLNNAIQKRKFLLTKKAKNPKLIKIIKSEDSDLINSQFSAYLKKTNFAKKSKGNNK